VETTIREDDSLDLIKKLSKLDSLYNFVNEQPVYPEWKENIQKMEFFRAVQGTVALEGPDIELEDVERIAKQNERSNTDRYREAQNALEAYEFIQRWSSDNPDEEITESVIKQIHTIMTADMNDYVKQPGEYRTQIVEFGYPPLESALKDLVEIQDTMSMLVELMNAKEMDPSDLCSFPVTKALLVHYLITAILPFMDGNGRLARAVEALVLHHYGKYEAHFFPISARFYYRERKKYFEMLRHADNTGNPIPFISFALDGLHANLYEIEKHILDQINRTLILDYAHQLRRGKELSKRQTTLLENMFYLGPMKLDEFWRHPFVRGIYDKLSESTRKRDISKLISLGFVKYEKSGNNEGRKIKKITVNWDALRFATTGYDSSHRP
jgi:Fic family protein